MSQQATAQTVSEDYAFWSNLKEYNDLKRTLDKTADIEARWKILRRMEQLNDELEAMK